jgi:mRNA interferase MazF
MRIDRGDVVWADMSPVIGREQSGHRPYLVLSDDRLHRARQVVIAVPMTSKPHPIPTHVELAPGAYAICEQPKTFSVRRVTKVDRRSYDVSRVRAVVVRLIGG